MKAPLHFRWYTVPQHANEELLLSSERATLTWDSRSLSGIAEIRAECLPTPRLQIHIRASSPNAGEALQLMFEDMASAPMLALTERNAQTKSIVVNSNFSDPDQLYVTVTPLQEPWVLAQDSDLKLISRVDLLLLNFPKFREASLVHEENAASRRIGETEIVANDWVIRLQTLSEAKQILKELKAQGGYGVTHLVVHQSSIDG